MAVVDDLDPGSPFNMPIRRPGAMRSVAILWLAALLSRRVGDGLVAGNGPVSHLTSTLRAGPHFRGRRRLPIFPCTFDHGPDPRNDDARRDLAGLLGVAFLALLRGAGSCAGRAAFGRGKRPVCKDILKLRPAVPSHDTFSEMFRVIGPKALDGATGRVPTGSRVGSTTRCHHRRRQSPAPLAQPGRRGQTRVMGTLNALPLRRICLAGACGTVRRRQAGRSARNFGAVRHQPRGGCRHFTEGRFRRMAVASTGSARRSFGFVFSSSGTVSRLAFKGSMPPNRAFRTRGVARQPDGHDRDLPSSHKLALGAGRR